MLLQESKNIKELLQFLIISIMEFMYSLRYIGMHIFIFIKRQYAFFLPVA